MNKEEKLKTLIESREKTLEKLERTDKRLKETKDNEEAWPGHENTRLSDDLNQRDMLKSHLELIEAEIKELKD